MLPFNVLKSNVKKGREKVTKISTVVSDGFTVLSSICLTAVKVEQ